MRILFQNQWLKWLSVFVLAVLVLGGAYYYQTMSLGKVQAAYTIASSTRFISGNSDYLSRTPGSAPTSQRKFTLSFWAKRANLGITTGLWESNTAASTDLEYLYFNTANKLRFEVQVNGGSSYGIITDAVYRDPSAWLHIVLAVYTTLATAADRQILYVNGVRQSITTLFSGEIPQNTDLETNDNGSPNRFPGSSAAAGYFDGYISDAYMVDGQALTPTS
ncbi:MAG TPA: LamG-like jellyroll fold domain-containing protein, partial [Candidatus Paceibacterota bacterium]|nr:LamG-like jellyroll fold domain-containing protein [Candidatus Paceibacterota bacterium]